jgi:hypothetical protein
VHPAAAGPRHSYAFAPGTLYLDAMHFLIGWAYRASSLG